LQIRRQFTYLVKKNARPMGNLKSSCFPRVGTGKSPPFVTKQFTFNEVSGKGGTVYLYQGPIFPRTVLVDRPGNQLLTGTCLPENEDRGIRGRNLFNLEQNILERITAPDDIIIIAFQCDLFTEIGLLRLNLLFILLD